MTKKKVSIIVPVYNSAPYLSRCINSIIKQDYTNIEIILVDDGSTDESGIICKRIAQKDKRILYFYKENGGSSSARNYGIEQATGYYIMFVDSDDSIEKQMVSSLVNNIEISDSDFAISGIKVIHENGKVVEHKNKSNHINDIKNQVDLIIDLFSSEKINGPVAKLYKSSIINKNNIRMPKSIHLNEDLNFNVDYMKNIKSIFVDSNCYYNYYHNGNMSVTLKYYEDRYEMLNSVNDNIISYFELLGCKEINEIYYLYVKIVYSSFLNLFHLNCQKHPKEKREYIRKIINSKAFKNKISKAERKGLKYIFLLNILKTRTVFFIYFFCKILFYIRKKGIAKY